MRKIVFKPGYQCVFFHFLHTLPFLSVANVHLLNVTQSAEQWRVFNRSKKNLNELLKLLKRRNLKTPNRRLGQLGSQQIFKIFVNGGL